MKRKPLIAMFVAFGLLALVGAGHAAVVDYFMPTGAVAKGEIVGNKLMLQTGPGKTAPAPDGIYRTGDGKEIVVKGGAIVQIPGVGPFDGKSKAARPGDLKKSGPAGTMGGSMPGPGGKTMSEGPAVKEKNKPEKGPNKPDKKNQMVPDSAAPGQGPTKATPVPQLTDGPAKALPMPQGIQDPGKALPMPQGTQGSAPPLGSPKDPSGPEGTSMPGGGPPPPTAK